nr:BICD family-like cargo adapter 1 [Leptinotarsa decemlineata]
MNSNLKHAVEELKKNFRDQEFAFDYVDMEKCLREFKTELYIKREEVKQLRNDLESANFEIKELKKAYDTVNTLHEEKTFNLNLLMNKSGNQEKELLEKRDSLMTLQMQHKMTVAEIEILKEKLQNSESEKHEFTRKLENFEAKQRHDFIYHNAIMKRETNLRSMMEEMNVMMAKLKKDHTEIMKLSNQTKFAEELTEKIQHLSRNYEKLKEEKENFEELYIKISAKCEKLQEFMAPRSEIHEPNLITKIIFNHWKTNRARYSEKMDEILTKITESYNSEKTTNIQLIFRNEELTELLQKANYHIKNLDCENERLKESHLIMTEELKTKIEQLEERMRKSGISEITEIKDEPIEID